MKTYTRFLLAVSILAITCLPAIAWASQMEFKLTDSSKHLCAESAHSAQSSNTQEQSTATEDKLKDALIKEAQLCPLSRRVQLKPLLYDLITILPLDLLQIIISYDIHTLTGHEQHCLAVEPRARVVTLENTKNENIFYSHSDDGSSYWWNAATGKEVIRIVPQAKKKIPREHPRLSRSDARIGQTVALADGMLARENYPEILVINPNNKTRILSFVTCATKLERVSALCALADGRLVTGHESGAIKLWT